MRISSGPGRSRRPPGQPPRHPLGGRGGARARLGAGGPSAHRQVTRLPAFLPFGRSPRACRDDSSWFGFFFFLHLSASVSWRRVTAVWNKNWLTPSTPAPSPWSASTRSPAPSGYQRARAPRRTTNQSFATQFWRIGIVVVALLKRSERLDFVCAATNENYFQCRMKPE